MTRQRELDLIRERHAAGRFDSAPDHDAVTFLLAEVDRLTEQVTALTESHTANLYLLIEARAIAAWWREQIPGGDVRPDDYLFPWEAQP